MRINNNLMALNAHRYMSQANQKQSKSLEKLSSGLAINSAADNAAGLAISEKMRAQINGLEQAQSNAQDGISMIQTAEGALQESENILQRMRELAVQSSNDTNTAEDRAEIQKEIDQLANEITRISESTEFNTKKLLDGSLTGKLHIGANEGQDLSLAINAMDSETLKVNGMGGDVVGGDVSSVSVSGTAASLVSGNVITVATSEVFGAVLSDQVGITGITATAGGLVVDGAEITITTTQTQAAQSASQASLTIGGENGFTATAVAGGVAGNAYTVNIVQGSGTDVATSGVIDGDGNVTITLGTTGTDPATVTGTQIAGLTFTGAGAGLITFEAAGTGAGTITTATSANLADGADAQDQLFSVTFSNGTEASDVTVTGVAADAANVAGTGGFSTLSFATGGAVTATTAGTVTIGESYTLTISDTEGSTQQTITGLAANATTAAGTGDFAGIEFTLDGALADGQSSEITITSDGGINVSTQEAASKAITTINTAINAVSAERANLGSIQNRLSHTINNLSTTSENMTASESRIRDVDMAKEMMEYTKLGILQQASQAMLAQANVAPQGVLQLLQ